MGMVAEIFFKMVVIFFRVCRVQWILKIFVSKIRFRKRFPISSIARLCRLDRFVVDEEAAVFIKNLVAGKTDDSFDKKRILIFGIFKNDDFAALGQAELNQPLFSKRQADSIDEFVNKNVVVNYR